MKKVTILHWFAACKSSISYIWVTSVFCETLPEVPVFQSEHIRCPLDGKSIFNCLHFEGVFDPEKSC